MQVGENQVGENEEAPFQSFAEAISWVAVLVHKRTRG